MKGGEMRDDAEVGLQHWLLPPIPSRSSSPPWQAKVGRMPLVTSSHVATLIWGSGLVELYALAGGESHTLAFDDVLVVRNLLENIDFLQTPGSYLSHLHLLCVVKAPPWQSSSMGRETLVAAAFPKRRKNKVWQIHMVASPLSSSRKPLLWREAVMGAQPPATRGEASGIRQDPLSRCCSWKVQMFYTYTTGRMKNKNLFLWKYFFPLTENRNICISFAQRYLCTFFLPP